VRKALRNGVRGARASHQDVPLAVEQQVDDVAQALV
jgi:hypothetical protein